MRIYELIEKLSKIPVNEHDAVVGSWNPVFREFSELEDVELVKDNGKPYLQMLFKAD